MGRGRRSRPFWARRRQGPQPQRRDGQRPADQLPAAQHGPGPVPTAGDERGKSPSSRRSIIVAEDSASFGGLFVAVLRGEGYGAVRAWDAGDAARIARDRRPDLVVLDLSLPHVEQAPLFDELAAQPELAGIPIIVLTSHPLEAALTPSTEVNVVAKPIEIERFLNMVREIFGEPAKELAERRQDLADVHLHSW